MIDGTLAALAKAAGILGRWTDAFGNSRTVKPDTIRAILAALGLPASTDQQLRGSRSFLKAMTKPVQLPALVTAEVGRAVEIPVIKARPKRYRIECEDGLVIDGAVVTQANGCVALPPVESWGYHRLTLGEQTSTLAVAPRRCFGVADVPNHAPAWGLAAQLYSLRRDGDGGVGDYPALAALARTMARSGADAVVVSPVHAMFSGDPTRYSPYAPSNRLFLNVLHIDVTKLCAQAGVSHDDHAWREMQRCEHLPLIDWPAVTILKLNLMRRAFDAMVERGSMAPDTPDGLAFTEFRRDRGEALERHARFEALQTRIFRADKTRWHWQTWQGGLRDPGSDGVATFARESAHEVAFHAFLQWRAESALAEAQAAAVNTGMRFGLIADLAVGTDSGGSHAWGHQSEILSGLSIGAPPDLLNPLGQGWGLTTFSPHALRREGYAPFIALLRAAMRHGGGVRIDHVLGLERLWLVPPGTTARDGAYLMYPLQDLRRLVALESWRHRALVIGEDLGTVPPGFRALLRNAGILGTRVLWFERHNAGFAPVRKWPAAAVATSSTHDLPTVAGWWAGRDLEWRTRLGLLGEHETAASLEADRAAARAALWQALRKAGVAGGDPPPHDEPTRLLTAVAAFLGATPCALALLPLEDVLGLTEQPNLPGTIDIHPNWRRRLPVTVDMLMDEPDVRSRIHLLSRTRRAA